MCISFPAKIVSVQEFIVFVDYGNNVIEPVISNVDNLKPGDYVVVSYGMIMEKITEEEYNEMVRYSQELAQVLNHE